MGKHSKTIKNCIVCGKDTKVCVVCGEEFQPRHGNQKAHIECKKQLAILRGYKYREHKSQPVVQKICLYCGKTFDTNLKYKKYCNSECTIKAGHQIGRTRRTQEERNSRPQITCVICGKLFTTSRKRFRYCSDECRDQGYQLVDQSCREKQKEKAKLEYVPKRPTKRICLYCGHEFSKVGKGNYCCPDHMHIAFYGTEIPTEKSKLCGYCGKTFITKRSRQLYCSECRGRADALRKLEMNKRRDARLKSRIVKPVDRLEIFKRDNWICQICGKKVDPKLRHPHALSASLDHILPIANGGTHEPRNCQLAHFICNSKKSNLLPAQLRLIE